MTAPPRIVFLDQNKWVDLFKAETFPAEFPQESSILQWLLDQTDAGKIVLPLSSTNIYETYKIGDPAKREGLGSLQARLSKGLVFRGRHHRLELEFAQFLANIYHFVPPYRAPWWFMSDVFLEAFADHGDPRVPEEISPRVIELIRDHGGLALHHYFSTAADAERLTAVKRWTAASEALCGRIEARRLRHRGESFSMRRKIYSAIMIADALDHLVQLAAKYEVDWRTADKIGSSVARRLVNEVPIYHVERELALRLEAQNRAIDENDLRDVQAYCAALIYADVVIGENNAINLARQAGLGKKYDTELQTSLSALLD